jgi:hypothetical protein
MKRLIIILIFFLLTACGDPETLSIKIFSDKATLIWTEVTTYNDGSPCIGVIYKVYYGSSSGFYTASINVGNVLTYDVTDKPDGTYFVVTAVDPFGAESDFSNEVRK